MPFDIRSASEFLHNELHLQIEDVSSVGQGEWSEAYFFRVGDQHKVILFNAKEYDFLKNQAAHRYSSDLLPIPRIESHGSTPNGFYAITPRVSGVMIDDLDATRMKHALPSLLNLFDALRLADVSDSKNYGWWNTQYEGNTQSWKECIASVAAEGASSWMKWEEGLAVRPNIQTLFYKVNEKMQSLLKFCPESKHLVHNDLLHYNVLVEDNSISGVIDWGNSLYGDFLYDPATFVLWQFHYPAMKNIDFFQEVRTFFETKDADLSNYEERMLCYQCHQALESMKYALYKDRDKDLDRIVGRISQILGI